MILGGLDSYSSSVQNAALANEFKGNLFEYLIASNLARRSSIEASFLQSLPENFKQQLSFYETWMRKHQNNLLSELPQLAKKASDFLITKLDAPIHSISLIGKIAAGSGQTQFAEADLLIKTSDRTIPLSIKLCKSNAFVNTKSAGIKTFISKYFGAFTQAQKLQDCLNQKVDFYFDCMGSKLYELAQLDWQGRFDAEWIDQGFSELPGMLDSAMNSVVGEYYSQVIGECHHILESFYIENRSLFSQSLLPLVGISDVDMLLLNCFHREEAGKTHQLDHMSLESIHSFDLDSIILTDLKDGISSFEIAFPEQILQIRVKAMNKFTTPGLKVNCSLKAIKTGGDS